MSLKILDPYLADSTISELMWNGYATAFAERAGKIVDMTSPFHSENEFESLLTELSRLKSTISPGSFHFDGMLPGGSRFHVTRPPMSPGGPTLTIRKFSPAYRGMENLVSAGCMTEKCRTFLEACVAWRMNIMISGSTGAGKTTILNALASKAGTGERIITIEDVPELQLNHRNWVRLVSVHDEHVVTTRDCLVGCLRMRPDRIIVGECRSSEALEMLQALNTGHSGGITTVHANSPIDALTRLESLILFHSGAEIPLRALRRQIADALNLVIHVKKGPDGQRMIDEVMEIVGMEGEMITRLPLFKRNPQNKLVSTGHAPSFLTEMERRGPGLPKGFFDPVAFET